MFIKRIKSDCVLLQRPIAHKGVHGKLNGKVIQGNSLEALKLAIELNIPFEFDILKTKDNIPVVFHDFVLTISGKEYLLNKLTLNEIRELTKDSEYIPTLEEIVQLNAKHVPMMLDFKETTFIFLNEYRRNIIKILKDYTGEFAIESFNPFFVFRMGQELKHALTGQLICRGKTLIDTFDFLTKPSIGNLYEKIQSIICFIANSDFIAMEISPNAKWNFKAQKLISEKVDQLQNSIVGITSTITKKPVLGWTLCSLEDVAIAPHIFKNYIYDVPSDDISEYAFFDKVLQNVMKNEHI
ncbi:MAG: glycerophosphodiester phosphodiesterase family protein [Clostridia bacterium]